MVHPGKGEDENSVERMPYAAAAALVRLGWHEAWAAALARAEQAGGPWRAADGSKGADWHRKRAAKAAEAWTGLLPQWAEKPRGKRDAAEVGKAILDAARGAAEHAAAMRVGLMGQQGKGSAKRTEEAATQAFDKFSAASASLKDLRLVIRRDLAQNALGVCWHCAWHAALTLEAAEEAAAEAQEDEEEEEDEEDDEGEEQEGGEDEDADDKFGDGYPGYSDDPVQEHLDAVARARALFWDDEFWWQGTRILLTEEASAAEAAVEDVSRVPTYSGTFPRKINSVRLVLAQASGAAKDPLGPAARAALAMADAAGLWAMLEVPARPGAKGEDWVRRVAQEAAASPSVRGVALPMALGAAGAGADAADGDGADVAGAGKLLAALRAGGLPPERCQAVLCAPEPNDFDADDDADGWTDDFRSLFKTDPEAAGLGTLLADGNVLLERAATFPSKEDGGPDDAQSALDAASHLADDLGMLDLVTWSAALPSGVKFKSKDGPTAEWRREFGQRLLASVNGSMESGWFFDAWEDAGSPDGAAGEGLKAALADGRLDLAADEQVMQPAGGKHTHSLVYLHGFNCDGYSYLAEPEHFYKVKKAKKKQKGQGAKSKAKDEEEEEDYEPIPGLKVVLPSAPTRKITAFSGDEKPSWYDYFTDLYGHGEDSYPPEELAEIVTRIHAIIDREVALVGARNVFVGGGSQGSGVALHCALIYAGDLGGVICTMGHVLSESEIRPEWVERKIPVFVYHGLADDTMPWDEWVAPTYKRLEDAGIEVRIQTEEGVEHGDAEAAWCRGFLADVLRPSSVKTVAKKDKNEKAAPKKKR